MKGFEECIQIVELSINGKSFKFFTDWDSAEKCLEQVKGDVFRAKPGSHLEIGLAPVYKYVGEQ